MSRQTPPKLFYKHTNPRKRTSPGLLCVVVSIEDGKRRLTIKTLRRPKHSDAQLHRVTNLLLKIMPRTPPRSEASERYKWARINRYFKEM